MTSDLVTVSRATLQAFADKAEKAAKIIKRNLYHQREKVADAHAMSVEIGCDIRAMLAASPAHATGAVREALEPSDEELDRWAYAFASWRQGQSSTPRCEAPGARDLQIARGLVVGVLAARQSMLAYPPRRAALSPPAPEGETAPVRAEADGVRIGDQLRAMGAEYDDDEDRWQHPAHRQQWLSESAAEYLGWIKGYAIGAEHAALSPEGETGPAVAVKPLEWKNSRNDFADGSGSRVSTAYPPLGGDYIIYHSKQEQFSWVTDGAARYFLASIDDAKADAQAHYEACILAALTVPSLSERDQHQGETLREKFEAQYAELRAFCEKHGKTDLMDQLWEVWQDCAAALSTPEPLPVADKREGKF